MTNMLQSPVSSSDIEKYFIVEETVGITPDDPELIPYRFTGGVPSPVKETLESQEINNTREKSAPRTGSEQTTDESSIELSPGSFNPIFEAILGAKFPTVTNMTGLSVTVDADAKTFTIDSGDLTSKVSVGDLVAFPGLTGNNGFPFIVTAVTTTTLTGGYSSRTLTDESSVASDLVLPRKIQTGKERQTVSLFVKVRKGDGSDEWHIARGVEYHSFSINVAVNQMVTGTFNGIGRSYEANAQLPTNTTFASPSTTEGFSGLDGSIIFDGSKIGFVTSITANNKNGASAQFAIGNSGVSHVTKGKASNSLTMETAYVDATLINLGLNEVPIEVIMILDGPDGAIAMTYPQGKVNPEALQVAGDADATQSVPFNAYAEGLNPSLILQQLTYS